MIFMGFIVMLRLFSMVYCSILVMYVFHHFIILMFRACLKFIIIVHFDVFCTILRCCFSNVAAGYVLKLRLVWHKNQPKILKRTKFRQALIIFHWFVNLIQTKTGSLICQNG